MPSQNHDNKDVEAGAMIRHRWPDQEESNAQPQEMTAAKDIHSIIETQFQGVTKGDLALMAQWKVAALEDLARLEVSKAKLSAQVEVFEKKLAAAKHVELVAVENELMRLESDLDSKRSWILQKLGLKARDDKMNVLIEAGRMHREHLHRIRLENFSSDGLGYVEKDLERSAINIYKRTSTEINAELGARLTTLTEDDRKNRLIP